MSCSAEDPTRPQQLLRKPVASTATVNTLLVLLLIVPQVFTLVDSSILSPALPPSTLTRAAPSCATTLSWDLLQQPTLVYVAGLVHSSSPVPAAVQ